MHHHDASAKWPVSFPCDYNGDGRDELALYDQESRNWYFTSIQGKSASLRFGVDDDDAIPVSGRFVQSSKSTIGFYLPRQSTWIFLKDSSAPDSKHTISVAQGGVPLVGDFDGDGLDDLAVYQPLSGLWSAWRSDGSKLFSSVSWGFRNAVPQVGDFNGDKLADLCVIDPASGVWYLTSPLNKMAPRLISGWGYAAAEPITRDFNGNGRTDICVWDRDGGYWFARDAMNGKPIYLGKEFGDLYAIAVPARYEGSEKVNLSYVSMGHVNWHVLTEEGPKVISQK